MADPILRPVSPSQRSSSVNSSYPELDRYSTSLVERTDPWEHMLRFLQSLQNQRRSMFMDEAGKAHFAPKVIEPPCEISEYDTHYVVKFEVPGMNKEELAVALSGNGRFLTIHGERVKDPMIPMRFSEMKYGTVCRSVEVPEDVVAGNNQMSASLDSGILNVTLPKASPTPPVRIEIN